MRWVVTPMADPEVELIEGTLLLNEHRTLREQALAIHISLRSGVPTEISEAGT